MKLGVACASASDSLVALLEAAGLEAAPLRAAVAPALLPCAGTTWFVGAGADVVTACEYGLLDAAVVGKDVLLESEADVFELLDLGVGADELVYAGPVDGPPRGRRLLRVATRYPRAARRHFVGSGRQAELVTFTATAVAPALGLCDGVVELRSLLPAGEEAFRVRETVAVCSARLIAGRAPRTLEAERLAALTARLRPLAREP